MLKKLLSSRRALGLLALALTILACSSVAALAAASSASVKIGDNWFKAKTVTVAKNGKVTWSWVGTKYHNVTVTSGPVKFHSKTQVKGIFSHIFTKAGTYHLECSVHPFMKMTVIVK